MTVGGLFIDPDGNIGRLALIVRIGFFRLISLKRLFEREAILLRNAAERHVCVGLIGVLDVAGPADDQLFAGSLKRTDAACHGVVPVAYGERPF